MRVFEYGLLSSPSDWRMSELSDRLIPNLSNEPFDFVLGCVFDEILPWWWSDIKVSYVFHHVLAKKSLSPFAMVTWGSGGQLDEWQTVTRGGRVQKWPILRWRHFWMAPCEYITFFRQPTSFLSFYLSSHYFYPHICHVHMTRIHLYSIKSLSFTRPWIVHFLTNFGK